MICTSKKTVASALIPKKQTSLVRKRKIAPRPSPDRSRKQQPCSTSRYNNRWNKLTRSFEGCATQNCTSFRLKISNEDNIMKRTRWVVGLVLACVLVLFALPVMAQADTPQASAEQIRQALFTAQSKLLLND